MKIRDKIRGRKKKQEDNVFVNPVRIADLDKDTLSRIIKIINKCLNQGKRSRMYIQKQIITLTPSNYKLTTREISLIVNNIDMLNKAEDILKSIASIQNKKRKSQKTIQKLNQKVLNEGDMRIVGYANDILQQYENLANEYKKHKEDSEKQEQELNNYIDELKELENMPDKTSFNKRFAIENKIAITDIKQKITGNKIKATKEQANSFFTAIQSQIIKENKNNNVENACDDDLQDVVGRYLEQVKDVNNE